jgi:aminoglycoside phosphotransferase (APT) family kinase protein
MSQLDLLQADAADDALREHLDELVPRLFGHRGEIATVHLAPTGATTSYDTHIVMVELTTGEKRQLFLKNYGVFIRRKDDMEQRREREIAVYRELLPDAGLDTPEYYGCVRDDSRGQFWMLLEYVPGTPAAYLETPEWIKAAAWVGRMHAHFATKVQQLKRCHFLLQHDAAHFTHIADDARESVAQIHPDALPQFKPIADHYAPVVQAMVHHPFTLVHGASRTVNVMISRRQDGSERAVGYDWEEAALGSPIYDLSYLADGFKSPVLEQFFDSYRSGAAGAYPATIGDRDLRRTYECFRLHLITHSLAKARVRKYGAEVIAKLVREAVARFTELEGMRE